MGRAFSRAVAAQQQQIIDRVGRGFDPETGEGLAVSEPRRVLQREDLALRERTGRGTAELRRLAEAEDRARLSLRRRTGGRQTFFPRIGRPVTGLGEGASDVGSNLLG